jgi:L-histidine N-alpha-methyltransferase
MSDVAAIRFDESQFPENVRRDLLDSLRSGRINHKFHYDSVKQTQKWLALHQDYAPSRNDPACQEHYLRGFSRAARLFESAEATVVGLGCGGGRKDTQLLRELAATGRRLHYVPLDVSAPMTLVARGSSLQVIGPRQCTPCVADLLELKSLDALLEGIPDGRIITFFGMLPNFEPEAAFSLLKRLTRARDLVLLSANLAPGQDYVDGVRRVLPQYDNPSTADWLITFLIDLGISPDDGELSFDIEEFDSVVPLRRIVANFNFTKDREIAIDGEKINFVTGRKLRLFYSFRYTETKLRAFLERSNFEIVESWIVPSEEEGIFLARREK